ncbi:MAG: DUF1592 domain-containing protein [Myxococcaceae bacterium]|nr:DUF1592 domain-containing protein [Myxococcaceae bacterium]
MPHPALRWTLPILCLAGCEAVITPGAGSDPVAVPELPQGGGITAQCTDPNLIAPTVRLARLTHVQYGNLVRVALGVTAQTGQFGQDAASGGFTNNAAALAPSSRLVGDWNRSAEELAAQVSSSAQLLAAVAPCAGGQTKACFDTFVVTTGKKLYRKPLTAAQATKLQTAWSLAGPLYDTGTQYAKAVRMALEAMLQSPAFLYRAELSDLADATHAIALTNDEVAERLALSLWGSTPDDLLFAAAAEGRLATREGVAAEARRMLGDAKARPIVRDFYEQWLGLHETHDLFKVPAVYPGFDANIGPDLTEETERFVEELTFDGAHGFKDLFTAEFTYMNGPIAALYGQTGVQGAGFQRVTLDGTRRKGLLTQPSFLATQAYPDSDSPIHRGAYVLRRLMCAQFSPPGGIDFTLPSVSAQLKTTRDRIADKTKAEGCMVCHGSLNPVGFSFQHYDGIGRWRDTDNGVPVDASGGLPTPAGMVNVTKWKSNPPTPVDGALQLQDQLADHETARRCFSVMWLNYLGGRLDGPQDACQVERLSAGMAKGELSLKDVLVDLVSSRAFTHRAEETP